MCEKDKNLNIFSFLRRHKRVLIFFALLYCVVLGVFLYLYFATCKVIDWGSFLGGSLAYFGTSIVSLLTFHQNERVVDINKEMQRHSLIENCRVAIKVSTSVDFSYSDFSKMQANTSIKDKSQLHEFYDKVYSTLSIASTPRAYYSNIVLFLQNVGKSEALRVEVSDYSVFICPNQVGQETSKSCIQAFHKINGEAPYEGTTRDYVTSGERYFLSLALDNGAKMAHEEISAEQERKLREVARNHSSVMLRVELGIKTISGNIIKEQCVLFGAITKGKYLCSHSDQSIANILSLFNKNLDYITWAPYLGYNEYTIDLQI